MALECKNCHGTGMVFDMPCKVCFPGDRMSLAFDLPPNPGQTGIITDICVPEDFEVVFPLTADECHLFYSELVTHTFSRDHPMYHYASAILRRMRTFIERNNDKLNLCKDVKLDG